MPAPPAMRPAAPVKKMSSNATMRVPTMRPGISRERTATPALVGRASSTDSSASSRQRTPKRKAPASEPDIGGADEETNINVVVRCRGRNDREVRENSGVVVSTDGIQGKKVELSMGPSALSNKTYSFDKVFSPAADQDMVFDEVVTPILDNVLAGFNCTIFAYGQTGTGKTYTMSGDITDMLPIPDAAGIIPRVLHSLFTRLGDDGSEKSEYNVKCSFIELYNEELRDLLAHDDSVKLKIFDDANKNGRTTTMVQGMEESHITSAATGIKLLREGSHKRQVAATKCNDLSSRSHTVFTITVYMKKTSDTGEEFVSAGKLNLVDLAGSENIQRSGAENKRAAEAGLINKSLLTLGRVINALVEKGSHIPYRESKLTRLLQDSLGGRTKTCIIATLSPAKSNLEETISTLDYAFRAKNIRNKPQVNQVVSKKTLLKEFTSEIEKLKSELIATRQRNGVYLTQENFEEITTISESRRILGEEQRDKIETMEANLRNKVQELFTLTIKFSSLKKDSEQTRTVLDGTKGILEKTQLVLDYTKQSLEEEMGLRKAHQDTESKLAAMGEDLLSTLGTTTDHVDRLHSKLKRRSDLQLLNRSKWADAQSQVTERTISVEERIESLRSEQEALVSGLTARMQSFIDGELNELRNSQALLQEKAASFKESEAEVNGQTAKSRDHMNEVLEEIRTLRGDVKEKVGVGLSDLSAAAQRISEGVASELDAFHSQLFESYSSLGREFKSTFEDLVRRMTEQQAENERLRQQMSSASDIFAQAGEISQIELQRAFEEERKTTASERDTLMTQIANLINNSASTQESRMNVHLETANKRIRTSQDQYRIAQQVYGSGMDAWKVNARALVNSSVQSRESIKARLKADWGAANDHSSKITKTAKAVHGETVRIVGDQMAQMDSQLVALDEIVSRVKAQNEDHHQTHTQSLSLLACNVQQSYQSIGDHFETSYSRTKGIGEDMRERAGDLQESLPGLAEEGDIRQDIRTLRDDIAASQIQEYAATGETPARTQYSYPTTIPRTEAHEKLLNRMRGMPEEQPVSPIKSPQKSPNKRSPSKHPRSSPTKGAASPTKQPVWQDTPLTLAPPHFTPNSAPTTRPQTASSNASKDSTLRDIDVNVAAGGLAVSTITVGAEGNEGKLESKISAPPLKRHKTDSMLSQSQGPESNLSAKRFARQTIAGLAEGRENMTPASNLSASVGPGGRRLRSRGSD